MHPSRFLNIHFNYSRVYTKVFQVVVSLKFSHQNHLYTSPLSHKCPIPFPSYCFLFHHSNKIVFDSEHKIVKLTQNTEEKGKLKKPKNNERRLALYHRFSSMPAQTCYGVTFTLQKAGHLFLVSPSCNGIFIRYMPSETICIQ